YGLATAVPGEKWYFADNDEYINVPDHWRMYFTANIGRQHGVYDVPQAFASRGAEVGEVMKIGYPPLREELMVTLATLSDAQGNFLRSDEDLGRLSVLVKEVFPKVRAVTERF